MSRRGLLVVLFVATWVAPAPAQTGPELRDQGLTAYRALEMEAAARLLRLALASRDLPDTEVLSTEAYLGAAEFYRNRQDSSRAAFRRIVLREPRYRLDPLVFPPDVTRAYDAVRYATPAVSVDVPRRARFEPGRGGLTARVIPSGPHVVRVRIERSNGEVVRTLHDRRVTDSLSVTWDGAGARDATLASGLYVWSFASLSGDGRVRRILDVPVRLERSSVGTQTLPPQPTLLPERSPVKPALVRLGLGLGAATLSWFVMPAFTDRDGPRVALAVAFSAAGIIGFFEKRPGKPLPQNVAANQAALEAWDAEVRRATAANQGRRPGPRIILETSRPSIRR
ncbi:MAG: hypothetical protein OER90_02820 [Gemmatimonadota bacterium]|nr:hypothetical protein [Gemmatimonadota bacterium]